MLPLDYSSTPSCRPPQLCIFHFYKTTTSLYPLPPLVPSLVSLHSPPSRIPFLPWDFRDFSSLGFLWGPARRGKAKQRSKSCDLYRLDSSPPFFSLLALRFLCASLLRPTCLSSLSSPLPTPPVLLFSGKKKKEEIFWCKIRSAVAALLHRDLLLSWPVWLGGLLEWHGFLFLGCCSS